MASQEQSRELTGMVLEALAYRRLCGANDNPALGRAILYVHKLLLPWTRQQIADEFDDPSPDAENLVGDAGVEAILQFHRFDGTTGAEFYRWVRTIVAQFIAHAKRLRKALRNGGLRHIVSLERSQQAAALAELLVSPETPPDEATIIRENAARLDRAIQDLNPQQRRVVKLRMKGRSLRQIAATFAHAPSWAHDLWEAAVNQLRTKLLHGCHVGQKRMTIQAL